MFDDSNVAGFDVTSSTSLQSGQTGRRARPPPRMIGQLFLRLARLPPGSDDFAQIPKPRVSLVRPGQYISQLCALPR